MIFTSGDRLHENISPLFLREDQEFLWAPKLKEDLGRLDAGCWGATEQNAELRILFHCSPIPQYNIPIIHPLAQQVNRALGPYSLPLLQRTFGHVNPALSLLFNLAALASILFVLSMTLIPNLERLFLRDLIRRGEREGRKFEAIRERVQVRLEKKNHAR
jgi:hypothetical protein